MATLLTLVQDVGRDSGTLPNWATLASLTGASERALKIKAWVIEAWNNIQNEREDWLWMRGEFTGALVINQLRYQGVAAAPTGFGITRWGDWLEDDDYGFLPMTIYDPAEGVTDEGGIEQIHYLDWFERYGRNSHDANRPIHWAISPAGELVVGPKPDKAYVIKGMYQKSPQVLSADGDTPELPTRYHNLIKWEAIRLLQMSDGGWDNYKGAVVELEAARSHLNREQLPQVKVGGETIGI